MHHGSKVLDKDNNEAWYTNCKGQYRIVANILRKRCAPDYNGTLDYTPNHLDLIVSALESGEKSEREEMN